EAIYFRRKRHDPIRNPSLRQIDRRDYALSFFEMYNDMKNIHSQQKVQKILDKQLLNFYSKSIVNYFDGKVNISELFPELVKSMNRLDKNIMNPGKLEKREFGAIFNNDKKKYKRNFGQNLFLRDLKKGVKSKKAWYRFLYKHLFCKLSIKENLVFFESFLGKNYSDNPKYIYEYIDNQYPDYNAVWSFKETTSIPGKAKQVKRLSLRYYYTLARAKYWVSNSRMPYHLIKRENTVYLQTWHGTPLKRLVFDMEDVLLAGSRNYKENFYTQSRRWDYLNSANRFSSEVFRRAFQYNETMLEFGYPRNDILYQKNNLEDINNLKQSLGLPMNKKVILYAPTWRDDDYVKKDHYNFQLQLDLRSMQRQLGSEYIVILRTHYFISEQLDTSKFEGFAYNLSNHDDIAELYLVSDILITDYSSVFFDYANLQRPILFYTYDLEKYRD